MRPCHEDWEVGKGRIDPERLGGKLKGVSFLDCRYEGSGENWLGAAACTLIILSLWLHLPVTDVVAFALAHLRTLLLS